jgi:flagellar FliL protein
MENGEARRLLREGPEVRGKMAEEPNAGAPAAAAPAKGGSKLVPIILVTNTLLMAGVLFMVLKKPAAGPAAAAEPAAEGHGESKGEGHGEEGGHEKSGGGGKKEEGPGPMVKLDNFVIQLKAADSERYVRVAFDLEMKAEPDKDLVAARLSPIRDSIIAYFSDRNIEDLRGSQGMEKTKGELKARLDEIVPGNRIKAVYVTDFIVQ